MTAKTKLKEQIFPVIGVMGSGKQDWADWAKPLGRMLAGQGVHLLTGAGDGTMAVVSEAFCSVEKRYGLCLGVIPHDRGEDGLYCPRAGYPNSYVELAVRAPLGIYAGEDPYALSRNHINVMTSHALVILPGTQGTINEVHIALLYDKPMILFGPEEGYKGFPDGLERTENLDRVERFVNENISLLLGTDRKETEKAQL